MRFLGVEIINDGVVLFLRRQTDDGDANDGADDNGDADDDDAEDDDGDDRSGSTSELVASDSTSALLPSLSLSPAGSGRPSQHKSQCPISS